MWLKVTHTSAASHDWWLTYPGYLPPDWSVELKPNLRFDRDTHNPYLRQYSCLLSRSTAHTLYRLIIDLADKCIVTVSLNLTNQIDYLPSSLIDLATRQTHPFEVSYVQFRLYCIFILSYHLQYFIYILSTKIYQGATYTIKLLLCHSIILLRQALIISS